MSQEKGGTNSMGYLQMTASRLIPLIFAFALLGGCQSMLAMGAWGGMAVSAAMRAKPDRKLEYAIEVKTVESRIFRFEGSTECPHYVGMDVSGYSTKTSYAFSIGDPQWVLTGIDCNNEIVHKAENLRAYRLYRVIDDSQGKVYFVMPGGPAQITRGSFRSSVHPSSQDRSSYFQKYGDGPFFYSKIFLTHTPPSVSGYEKPIVVYEGRNLCGRHNPEGLSIEPALFLEDFRRGRTITAIERGYLEYRADAKGWAPTPGAEPSVPLDVAVRSHREPGCTRLIVGGREFVVSYGGFTVLYLPDEKAFYRVSRVAHHHIERRARQEKNWSPCGKPAEGERFAVGTMYVIPAVAHPALSRVARKNADGSYSCQPRFGISSVS